MSSAQLRCCRRNSSVSEVAAAVTEAAMAGVISGASGQTDSAHSSLNGLTSSNTAGETTQDGATSSNAVSDTAGIAVNGPSTRETQGNSGLSSQQDVRVDTDQMAMRLALDVLWTGSGPGAAQHPAQASENTDALQ